MKSLYETPPIKAILIDDDKFFGAMMSHIAELYPNVTLDYVPSFADIGWIGNLQNYDLVLTDYFLESWNGLEIAEYVEVLCNTLPVVIVSAKEDLGKSHSSMPQCVKAVFPKSMRPDQLLLKSLVSANLVPVEMLA